MTDIVSKFMVQRDWATPTKQDYEAWPRTGCKERILTSRPKIVNSSSALLPASKVVLHDSLKVRLCRLNQRTVIPIIFIQLSIINESPVCATTNHTAIGPWDDVVSISILEIQPVCVVEVRWWMRGVFRRADVRACAFPGQNLLAVERDDAGSVPVGCVDDLLGLDGPTWRCDGRCPVFRNCDRRYWGVGLDIDRSPLQ